MSDDAVTRAGSADDNDVPDSDVRVFVINHRDIVRRGLRAVLEDADDLVVVGESAGVESCVPEVERAEPDVAIIDGTGAPTEAVEAVRTLRDERDDVQLVILGHADVERTRRTAIDAGADGYLLDDAVAGDVHDAVRHAARGDRMPGTPAGAGGAVADQNEIVPDLTLRERQVLSLIAAGMTNRQIGERLGLAEKTVKNYTSAVLAKLHVQRRTQAAIYSMTHAENPAPRSRN
ncbi:MULTISPECIES: response regulator transcription factor [unclassified Microbacterium]|uniref:LuxR C-terminal-related transcriptional regulator n=1 Tax=unclassified Microbacterium TaxID=2609290 RepID=UPI00214C1222|nr:MULTISPECIES: response regulator transcription factor [unclassified Microbacterium]MCR2809809.1 response regulator transcription factor [Microbacterium sp. zg.B185]WIM17880.1 response regulator transcription factor [Microbacterium sp. zg-B185]